MFIPLALFVCYFFLWRSQQRQHKEKEVLLSEIEIGDVIYTSGGVVGKITKLMDNLCQIEVATNIKIYIQKDSISNIVPKGSLKTLGFA